MGKIPKGGGRGLTQTHFLMSIVIFGMPKNCDFLVTTKNVPEESVNWEFFPYNPVFFLTAPLEKHLRFILAFQK